MLNKTCYTLETASKPTISFLVNDQPKAIKLLAGFHKLLGFPEAYVTTQDGFSLHIKKGKRLESAAIDALDDLDDSEFVWESEEQKKITNKYVRRLTAGLN